MIKKSVKGILLLTLASLSLVACSRGSSGGGAGEASQASSLATPEKASKNQNSNSGVSNSSNGSQVVISNGSTFVNSGGSQNIATNGSCAPGQNIGSGNQMVVLNRQTISNVVTTKKSAASDLVECQLIESGDSIALDGRKVCVSSEACLARFAEYDAVRTVASSCRDAVILSDAQVASLLQSR